MSLSSTLNKTDGPKGRRQGLSKHEDIVLRRCSVSCGVFKSHQTQVGADMVPGDMSMQHPWDARIPFAIVGHLVMPGQ